MFNHLPNNKPIAVLMRHAEREEIPVGELGNDVVLTAAGKAACVKLAKKFPQVIKNLYTSPVKRCLQTAELFLPFSQAASVIHSHLLGDPGIFICDPEQASQSFMQYKPFEIVRQLLNDQINPLGFCDSTKQTVYKLIDFLLAASVQKGTSLFITHDSILSVVLGIFFAEISLEELWPNYLEMLIVWRERNSLCLAYRQHTKRFLQFSN